MPDYTLRFQLEAPLQSWGVQSLFGHRETMKEPTKSGVVGLLAAALGRQRHEDISDLASLKMAVRADAEGMMLRDFHTAGIDGFVRASGAVERKNPIVSNRFYLVDASFTIALQHTDRPFLEQLALALRHPVYPLYLGRKSCPPVHLQKTLVIEEQSALVLLMKDVKEPKRIVADKSLAPTDVEAYWKRMNALFRTAPDQPISFRPRRFALRETCLFYTNHETPNHHVSH